MSESTGSLLQIALTVQGVELVRRVVTNLLDTMAVRNFDGSRVAYANRYAAGTALAYTIPANPKHQPTANITAAQQNIVGLAAVFAGLDPLWNAGPNGSRKIGVHVLLAVDRLLAFGAAGTIEIMRLVAAPAEYSDASHLYVLNDTHLGLLHGGAAGLQGGQRQRLAECCFEPHGANMSRIACGIFSTRFGGGCICPAGVANNMFKPRCKTLPAVVRATVNGQAV